MVKTTMSGGPLLELASDLRGARVIASANTLSVRAKCTGSYAESAGCSYIFLRTRSRSQDNRALQSPCTFCVSVTWR